MRVLLLGVWCVLLAALQLPAQAQSPLPPAREAAAPQRYVIAALGDSLGDGVWEGVQRAMRGDRRVTVMRGARNSIGFTHSDLTSQIEPFLARGPVDAVTMMVGANDDRHSFFINGRAIAVFGTPAWVELYRARVAKFMDHLERTNAPVIWLLLPVMRTAEANRSAKIINDLIVEAARGRKHVMIVETRPATADEKGNFAPYFNDVGGRKRLMRQPDGVHFTAPGYELLAQLAIARLLEVSGSLRAVAPPPTTPQTLTP